VLALAFLAESLTEYLFAAPLSAARLPADVIRYVAVAVGVLLAWAYDLDITRDVLGRGASYVHDFYGSYLRPGDVKEAGGAR
jgi:hypothetical protein